MIKGSKHKEETRERISQSMQGNDNAEKWTEDTVKPILEKFYEAALNDINNDIILINDLLITEGLYRDIWAEWCEKFKNNETVFRLIKNIESILESRIFSNAIKGKYNPTVAIFGLKNKYGWKDKTETDVTSGGEKIKSSLDNLSTDDLKTLLAIKKKARQINA